MSLIMQEVSQRNDEVAMPNADNDSLTPHESGAEQFLNERKVKYEKHADGRLVVPGNLNVSGLGLKHLPDLSSVTVEGCFDCSKNKLADLKGSPAAVGRQYICTYNDLKDLSGITRTIGEDVICSNQSTSMNVTKLYSEGKLNGPDSYHVIRSDYGDVTEIPGGAKQLDFDTHVVNELDWALKEGVPETLEWICRYAKTTNDDKSLDPRGKKVAEVLESAGYKAGEFAGDARVKDDSEIMARSFLGQVIHHLHDGKLLPDIGAMNAYNNFMKLSARSSNPEPAGAPPAAVAAIVSVSDDDYGRQAPPPSVKPDRAPGISPPPEQPARAGGPSKQGVVDDLTGRRLDEAVKQGLSATIKWVKEYAEATEEAGVDGRRQKVSDTLTGAGYKENEFVGDTRKDNKEVVGRYIVGQVISCLDAGIPLPRIVPDRCDALLKMPDGHAHAAQPAHPKV
jgi:hypothetical protein